LRPDDFWHAILTQFSFYVNAHAEELRDRIVDFKGKKVLTVCSGEPGRADYMAMLSERMVTEQIVKNIKDPSIADWMLPDFTTTMEKDRFVASMAVMSTLQKFFEFRFSIC
jgi:hypothetical protein